METGKKVIVGTAGIAGAGLIVLGLYTLLVKPPAEREPAVEVRLSWD